MSVRVVVLGFVLAAGCGPAVSGDEMGSTSTGGGSTGDTVLTTEASTGSPHGSTGDSSTSGGEDGASTSTGMTREGYCLEAGPTNQVGFAQFRIGDVDGNGFDDAWSLDAEQNSFFNVHGYEIVNVSLAPAFEGSVPGMAFDLADIDGDGHDDVVRSWEEGTHYHRGGPGLTIEDEGLPLFGPIVSWSSAFVDFDHDGDGDLVLRAAEGDVAGVQVWRNVAGTLELEGFVEVPGAAPDDLLVGAAALPQSPRVVVSMGSHVFILDLSSSVTYLDELPGPYFGSYIDEEGQLAVVARNDDAVAVRWRDGALEETPLLEDVVQAAVGEFIGTQGPQLLARLADEQLVLLQLSDLALTPIDLAGTPPILLPDRAILPESGPAVTMLQCSIGCDYVLARIVEC